MLDDARRRRRRRMKIAVALSFLLPLLAAGLVSRALL
jgi:hypothetical protein